MSAPAVLLEADANQARASDPAASAWVSANAGTGKTAVLVKRVLRLLIAGFSPESILCLTYTKTAAAEMQNRLLETLSQWATLPPGDLHAGLSRLLRREPAEENVRDARRLFARALEAKGGLKIYTIHGFCERLLQRFPLESQIAPHFSVLDEREQALLRRAAFDATVERAAEEKDSALGKALSSLIALTAGEYFRQIVNAVLDRRGEIASMVAHYEGRADWTEAERLALRRLFDVVEDEEEDLIEAQATVLSNEEIDTALRALESFPGGTKADGGVKAGLLAARASEGAARAAALEPVFMTKEGKPRVQLCSKDFARQTPEIAALLCRAQTDFVKVGDKLAALRVAEASAAVVTVADAVQAEYERLKQAKAALDYDDLIVKTQNLLSRADAAAWVLYKIDGGIDHILVDEAQDTNPAQWIIIERLAEEFFSGSGSSERLRTLFAVGDEKQSIYSFQGANPARFGEVGRAFKQRAAALALDWHEVPLNLSFRSTEPVLDAVDRVFAKPPAVNGLTWRNETLIQHHAFRKGQAGLVELWEVEADERAPLADAFAPWEEETAGARSVDRLCRRIATQIKTWIEFGEPLPSQGRNIRPGDILILVRRRDPFTTPMIRELKRLFIPVAGADRMKLMDQLGVKDLVALADVLLLQEDDLALAVVLKSPLFGFDDDALLALTRDRKRSLWSTLKAKAGDDPRLADASAKLSEWLARADTLPPYEFYSELLGAEGQRLRKAMLIRLGPEAAEAIDEFLDLALAYDREAAPSLQGFIHQLRTGDLEIKRDMEQGRDEVRIMTVHGAKGLQAPIVILPDTCMGPRAQNPRIFAPRREPPHEVCHLAWAPKGHSDIDGLAEAKAEADRADREEYHRLLYVAMTRAQDRLYVCGWQGVNRRDGSSWYDLIKAGLEGHLTEVDGADGSRVRRRESPQIAPVQSETDEERSAAWQPLPVWATTIAPPERSRHKLAPSRLALGQEDQEELGPEQPSLDPVSLSEDDRYARGRLVHALLQHLPDLELADQERGARAFVASRGANLSQQLRDEIVTETLAVIRNASFAPLFQAGSIAEVPVVARIGRYDLEGQIDRLANVDGGLLILDYKTNRPPPRTIDEVAPVYIAQLAAYRWALKDLYPEKPLRAALLWTDGPRLMEIPSTSLDEAERRLLEVRGKP